VTSGRLPRRRRAGRSIVLGAALAILGGCNRCDPAPSFTLHFPKTVSLGDLWLIEDVNCFTCGNGEKHLGAAMGSYDVYLPAPHWYVSLRMPKAASRLLPYLEAPSLGSIGEIDVEGSDVTDADLEHLAHVRFRSINLARTAITGEGLRHLSPHPTRWTAVDLRGCADLDPKFLVHFRGWKRATILLVDNRSSPLPSQEESTLLDAARRVICDEQPETVCGTQIR
jgi:hypothetical protein